MSTEITLRCDMVDGCTAPIAYIDTKGYIYCAPHGRERQAYQRCRKLTPVELTRLQSGEPLKEY